MTKTSADVMNSINEVKKDISGKKHLIGFDSIKSLMEDLDNDNNEKKNQSK